MNGGIKLEMKPVFLLIDEDRDIDFNSIRVARDLYEMPEYKEEYSENEILEYLKSELGNTVEITFLADEGVYFTLRENEEYFKFEKALKVGNEYFKLEKIRKNYTENIGGN